MDRSLFIRVADKIIEKNHYFQQQYDAAGRMSASSYQKITVALRMLANDVAVDSLNENVRISANVVLNCMKEFCGAIVRTFSEHYLREPTADDIRQLSIINTRRGFSGMLGSINCMHWRWKNCTTAWTGQYQSGYKKEPSIVLQAVASKDLWIWHAYFGVSGCNNDINVLGESDLFDSLLEGEAPPCNYHVNETQYNMGYYLADGIYPSWTCFVKTLPSPLSQNIVILLNTKKEFVMTPSVHLERCNHVGTF